MKIQIDAAADAAYIRLSEGITYESQEVEAGIVLDFDKSGHVIAIELLGVSKHMPQAILSKVEVISA